MFIQSIRLRNIKSYGEGPDGTGTTIRFEKGINRVSGRNGCGKTTLIECIGYALFLTNPQFEENFQNETYFLSHKAKEGEIELTFWYDGEHYRIFRPIGRATKRRSRVVQLNDESVCAEGDEDVAGFLCRLLKLPSSRELSDLFSKLVGVRQGRLAWPFDSKPTEAKRHFEPLLQVQIFRDCFDHLKGSTDIFQRQNQERANKLAAIQQRIQDRADSQARLAAARETVGATTNGLHAAEADRTTAAAELEQLEAKAKAIASLQAAYNLANNSATLTKSILTDLEARLSEAKGAGEILAETRAGYVSYREAIEALAELERRRDARDELRQKRDASQSQVSERQLNAKAATEQAETFSAQGQSKRQEQARLAEKMATIKTSLDSTAATYQRSAEQAETAEEYSRQIDGWVRSLPNWAKSQRQVADTIAKLATEIAAWDGTQVSAAVKADETARLDHMSVQEQLTRAQQRQTTVNEQLHQIAGGVCPLLKETCRQFDPAKLQADLEKQTAAVVALTQQIQKAKSTCDQTGAALVQLRATETTIASKTDELNRSLKSYAETSQTLISPDSIKSWNWLMDWESQLPPFPSAPNPPPEPWGPPQVAQIQEASEPFVLSIEAWWKQAETLLKARLKAIRDEGAARKSDQATLALHARQHDSLAEEVTNLTAQAEAKKADAVRLELEAQQLALDLVRLNEVLSPFANLDTDLKREQQKRDGHLPHHDRFLSAQKLAEDLPNREARRDQAQSAAAAAQTALDRASTDWQLALQSFDPKQLEAAKLRYSTVHDRVVTLAANLKSEQAAVEIEQKRCNEWEQARRDGALVSAEIGRCDAAIKLTNLARDTLKNTAPAVAQHLCRRIAGRAQRVFNQINPEPIELEWNAERYSLRVNPGDRRFAMLSGGEQTKLALSMTLAMIDELCGLRFCCFDEPTYGVDAESRHKMADAIVQAQESVGLDQLLLVSHDDAFEAKSDHAILLEKSLSGTAIVATS